MIAVVMWMRVSYRKILENTPETGRHATGRLGVRGDTARLTVYWLNGKIREACGG